MSLLDFLFPKQCFGCKKNGSYLCSSCINSLPTVRQKCIVCERPAVDGFTHHKCKGKYTIDRTISLWKYDGAVRKALIALKYKFAEEIAKELAEHTVQVLQKNNISFPANTILIPIPMHWQRKNWRGFNQVEEIGKRLNIKFESNFLVRMQKGSPQTGLNMEKRASNISRAFSLNPKYKILNTNFYILFDDVYTTGATLKEAGKVLKKSGVKKVWALTIAR